MNDYVKEHIYSAIITFVGTFCTTLGTSVTGLTSGDINTDLIFALIVTAGRVGFKSAFESFLPPSKLGLGK